MQFSQLTKLNTSSQGNGKLTRQMKKKSSVSEEVSMVKAKESLAK